MNKIIKTLGLICLAYLAVCVFMAVDKVDVNQSSTDSTLLTPAQEAEAQKLASESFVKHNDGSVTPLDLQKARIMVEDCGYLRRQKISDMTPEDLSVWNTCVSHGIKGY